jgi:hypothetical protein
MGEPHHPWPHHLLAHLPRSPILLWQATSSRSFRRARVFTTNVGDRPAEPCSISVAAMHQLLTQILLQTMLSTMQGTDGRMRGLGGTRLGDRTPHHPWSLLMCAHA